MPIAMLARIEPAHKQTGPRTTAGKERSGANATLHGGTSRKLIVAGETQADFDALLSSLIDEYAPDTTQSRLFVEELALAQWLLWRRHRAHSAIEAAVYEDQPDESRWTEEHLNRLALADRYKTQAERSFKRALANVENWRKENRREEQREIRYAQWTAAHTVSERRVSLAEQQFAAKQARAAGQPFRFAKPEPRPARAVQTAASGQEAL